MFSLGREANMSFFIPPSPEPDRDWALVPGNHTDVFVFHIFCSSILRSIPITVGN